MVKRIILIIISIAPYPGFAQCSSQIDTLSGQEVYFIADSLPKFDSGEADLFHYLAEQFKYPKFQSDTIISKSIVAFVVDTSGAVTYPRSLDKWPAHPYSRELVRVVGEMPNWTPAYCDAEQVPFIMTLPMRIYLK